MNITVSGDNLNIGHNLSQFTRKRISLVFIKYSFVPVSCNITFSKDQSRFKCYISSYFDASVGFQSKCDDRDIYNSMKICVSKFEKQIRRFKRRLKVYKQ